MKTVKAQGCCWVVVVVLTLLTVPSQAKYEEVRGDYIYTITPWVDYYTDQRFTRFLIETSTAVLSDSVKQLISQGLIPKKIMSMDDFKRLLMAKRQIKRVIQELEQMDELDKYRSPSAGSFSYWRPKAIMIFFGVGSSINFKAGISGRGQIGAVIMPVEVVETNILTGEVGEPYFDVRVHWVGMVAGGLGVGVGGGTRGSFGAMVIVGGPEFDRPDKFWGLGGGLAGTVVMGVGIELRTGFLSNTSVPGVIDFLYGMAAWEAGPAVTVEAHASGAAVFPLGFLLQALNIGAGDEVESYLDRIGQLEREMGSEDKRPYH